MKLTITKKPFKGRPVGAELEVTDRQARLLTKLGRAQYMTRDMVAAPVSAPSVSTISMPPRIVKVDGAEVGLDDLDAEALHALAKRMDVKVHHASGAEKVRTALIESQQVGDPE